MPPYTPDELSAALDNRYRDLAALSAGGQGAVYRARRILKTDHAPTDDEVALKLYHNPAEDERVLREIRAMSRIRHTGLAAVVEYGICQLRGEAVRFVSWEYINGVPLDQRIVVGPLPFVVVAVIGRDVASAVGKLWQGQIVHRDIKPANIIIRPGERGAALIDLGVARHLSEVSITVHGTTWGTRGYLSPEQSRAERQLSCKSDLFSLGVVLLESLGGRHPTNHDQTTLIQNPPDAASVAPLLPAGMVNLINSLLAPRAAFRPDPQATSDRFAQWVDLLEG